MRQKRQCRGFTLTEILIVLGIIGLLTAILLPVLGRVRENGRKAACASNLQQLGMAFQQYTNDWNRRYPLAGLYTDFANSPGWNTTGTANWVGGTYNQPLAEINAGPNYEKPISNAGSPTGYNIANPEAGSLYPYVKNKDVYICPSNPDGRVKRLSYTMNCAVSGLSSVKVRQPAEIILLVDEVAANDGFFFAVDDAAAGSESAPGTPTDSEDRLADYHNGGGNLLFADGHVKYYPFEKFVLDGTATGKANKWRLDGVPRFHDKAFGEFGSYKRPGAAVDSCNAKQRL